MYRRRLVALLLMSVLFMGDGSAEGPGGQEYLTGTTWILVALAGKELGPSTVTLRFEAAGALGGSDGCNHYRGSFSVEGSALHIPSDWVTTRMACPEPLMSRAKTYAKALGQTATFAIDGHRLSLRDNAGNEVAAFEAGSRDLAGTAWQVIAYNNGRQAVVSVLGGTHLTVVFEEDGRVTGHAGCNQYFAAYETARESITIGQPGSTRRFCAEPEGVMDQEARFLEALPSAATFRLEDEKLALRTADGALAVTLVRDAAAPH